MIFCWGWAKSSTVDFDRFGVGVYHHVRRVRVEAGGVGWYKPFGWDVDAPLKEGSGVAQGFQAVGPIGGRGVLHPSAGFSLASAIGQIGCQSCSCSVPVSKMVENHNRVSLTRRRASAASRGGGHDRSVGRGDRCTSALKSDSRCGRAVGCCSRSMPGGPLVPRG